MPSSLFPVSGAKPEMHHEAQVWRAKFIVASVPWRSLWRDGKRPDLARHFNFWHILIYPDHPDATNIMGTRDGSNWFHVLSSGNIRPICFHQGRPWSPWFWMVLDVSGMVESPAGSSFSSRSLKKICKRVLRLSASAWMQIWWRQVYSSILHIYQDMPDMQIPVCLNWFSVCIRLHCKDLPLWIPASEELVFVLVDLHVGHLAVKLKICRSCPCDPMIFETISTWEWQETTLKAMVSYGSHAVSRYWNFDWQRAPMDGAEDETLVPMLCHAVPCCAMLCPSLWWLNLKASRKVCENARLSVFQLSMRPSARRQTWSDIEAWFCPEPHRISRDLKGRRKAHPPRIENASTPFLKQVIFAVRTFESFRPRLRIFDLKKQGLLLWVWISLLEMLEDVGGTMRYCRGGYMGTWVQAQHMTHDPQACCDILLYVCGCVASIG